MFTADSSSVDHSTGAVFPMAAASIPFDTIASPGAYVCNWSGYLLRVSPDSLQADHRPMINLVGSTPLFVTKISDDPEVSACQARALAAERNLKTSF
jgi:hypothetical protein